MDKKMGGQPMMSKEDMDKMHREHQDAMDKKMAQMQRQRGGKKSK